MSPVLSLPAWMVTVLKTGECAVERMIVMIDMTRWFVTLSLEWGDVTEFAPAILEELLKLLFAKIYLCISFCLN